MIKETIRDYRILSKLGEGGMGQVWLAEHLHLGNRVAIKVLAAYLRDRPDFSQRFLLEARSQASLNHPNIIGVKDFFIENGQYFMVTEYCPGINLHEHLLAKGMLSVPASLKIIKPVLDALNYAHSKGVIHRDIKPANIMVGELETKVMDFGLASMAGVQLEGSDRQVIGSPHYMSPEQIRNPACTDHGIDCYAMGIVLYEMLTGRVPFDGQSTKEIWQRQLDEAPVSPRNYNPQISKTLNQIILRAIEKDPEERYAGCGEFLEFLTYLEEEELGDKSAKEPSPAAPTAEPAPRRERGRPGRAATRRDRPSRAREEVRQAPARPKPSPSGGMDRAKTLSGLEEEQAPERRQRKAPRGPNPVASLIRELPSWIYACFALLIAYFLPNLLGGIVKPPMMNLPFHIVEVKKVFFGGIHSPVGLSTAVILFSLLFSGLWILRAALQYGMRAEALTRSFGAASVLALVNCLLLFHWGLPIVLMGFTKLGLLEVFVEASGALSGPLPTVSFCYALWLLLMGLMAWLSSKAVEWYH